MKKIVILVGMVLFATITASAASKPDNLVYRLKWKFNTSVAGDIYAQEKGYFTEKGLSVTIKEGGPGINAISELELGRSHFGVASADQVIKALDKGAKIVVLAQLFQVSPMQWIYRGDRSEIKTLEELRGLRIGITFGGNDEAVMKTVFAMAGLKEKDVQIISVRANNAIPFFKGDADLWPVYLNSQGVKYKSDLAREGQTVRFFDPGRFGVNFVANSVITSQAMIEKHPKIVDLFLTALLKAWEAAMDKNNAADTLAVVKKLDRGNNDNIRQMQLDATRGLIKPSASVAIGTIDVKGWEQTRDILFSEGLIKNKVDILGHITAP